MSQTNFPVGWMEHAVPRTRRSVGRLDFLSLRGVAFAVVLVATACSAGRHVPLHRVDRVVLLPTDDRTGAGPFPGSSERLDRVLGLAPSPTPGQVASASAMEVLAERGIAVLDASTPVPALDASPASPGSVAGTKAAAGSLDVAGIARSRGVNRGSVLVITLRRLQPDIGSGSPLAVLVDLDATVIDLPSGETLWHAAWPPRAVRTGGSGSVLDASRRATREVLTELFAGLSPITPPARNPAPDSNGGSSP